MPKTIRKAPLHRGYPATLANREGNLKRGLVMAKKSATQTSVLESCFMDSCSCVLGSLAAFVIPDILPSSEFKPVCVTTALALPRVTTVPVKTMLV